MAILIRSISVGDIYVQSGYGVPSHLSPKGTIFVDIDGINEYLSNGDGTWKANNYLTPSQYAAITGSTNPSQGNPFVTFQDLGAFTGNTSPYLTGGTYSNTTGIATFTNSTGGTFNVNGFFKTSDDIYTTGVTFNTSNYNLAINRNDGASFTTNLGILAGDITITGGTYNPNNGVATFYNNSGGTFTVSGFTSGLTDTTVASFNYDNANKLTIIDSTGGTFNVIVNTMTGLTINGSLSATTYLNLPIQTDVYVTGGTYTNGTTIFRNNTGGTFSVSGYSTAITPSLTSTFVGVGSSANTISGTNNLTFTNNTLYVNGKIGVGTSSPLTALDVVGDLYISPATGGARIGDVGIGPYSFWASNLNEITTNFANTGTNLILQNLGGGKVGVGLTNPTANLHVKGSGTTSSGYTFVSQNLSNIDILKIRDDRAIIYGDSMNATRNVFENGLNRLIFGTNNEHDTANLYIKASTSLPSKFITVVNSANTNYFSIRNDGKSTFGLEQNYAIPYDSVLSVLGSATDKLFNVKNNVVNTDILTVNGNGNIGIGISTPTNKLTISGDNNSSILNVTDGTVSLVNAIYSSRGLFGTTTNHDLGFVTNTQERLTIQSTGNIGVNRSSPLATFDVNGTFRLTDGSEGVNKVLTSNSGGFGTWIAITALTPTSYFISGSTGTNSIRANNGSGVDARNTNAFAIGNNNLAAGQNSFAGGTLSQANGSVNFAFGNTNKVGIGVNNAAIGGSLNTITGSSALNSLNSFIGGGANITITGSPRSSAVGTILGTIVSGSQSLLLGGASLTLSGAQNSVLVGGLNNLLTGIRSVIIGGQNISGTSNDTIYTPAHNIININNDVALRIQSYSAQTQPLIYVSDSSSSELFRINTDNQFNLFIGKESGFQNSTVSGGIHNYGLGFQTLSSNIGGFRNVAIGSYALGFNLNGSKNTALGYAALYQNLSDNNSAFGDQALFSNTNGTQNMAFGTNALYTNTIGSYNVAIGVNALTANQSGSYNVAIGSQAGGSLTGDSNTIVGVQAGLNSVTGVGNVFLGRSAGTFEMGSNKLYISNSNTTTPLLWGDFNTNSIVLNGVANTGITSNTTYVDKLNVKTIIGTPVTALYLDANNFVVTGSTGGGGSSRYTTGFTYDNANKFSLTDSSGTTLSATINQVTGFTVNGNLNVSGTTTFKGLVKDAAGTTIIDLNSSYLINDNGGNPSIAFGGRQLYQSGIGSLNWGTRALYNSSSNMTLGWEACSLFDASGGSAIEWSTRRLIANDGTTRVANWNNGNFGIGIDSANEKLHISGGTLRINNGTEGLNKIAVSDANGKITFSGLTDLGIITGATTSVTGGTYSAGTTTLLKSDNTTIVITGYSNPMEIKDTLVFNFGDESDEVITTITGTSLTNNNIASFLAIPSGTTETSLDDFKLNGVIFNIENIIDNVSFDIRATALNNASGNYTMTYKIRYN